MRKIAVVAAALVAAATLASGPSVAAERLTGEAKLEKMLEGRVAGEPRSCINTRVHRDSTVINNTAVVYGRGKTIWVNRTVHPDSLNDWDSLLTRQHGTQLCRQDIVTTFDRSSGMYTGNIFLTEFVPYTRVD